MKLNERLKELREEKKYSQAYVADRLNVSRQAISKWENGWTSPDIDNLILLSELYGVRLEELTKYYSVNDELTMQKNSEERNSTASASEKDIPIFLISVIASTFVPIVGCIYCIWIFVKVRMKELKLPRIIIVILVICFLINLNNSLIVINNLFFHIGKATVL